MTPGGLKQVSLNGSRARRGFLLLELIVFIPIIGLLGMTLGFQAREIGPRARRTYVSADLKNILTVAESLYHSNGRYPETMAEMVNAKDENGEDAVASLDEMPKDPWGNEYLYEMVNGRPRVTCLGADKQQRGIEPRIILFLAVVAHGLRFCSSILAAPQFPGRCTPPGPPGHCGIEAHGLTSTCRAKRTGIHHSRKGGTPPC